MTSSKAKAEGKVVKTEEDNIAPDPRKITMDYRTINIYFLTEGLDFESLRTNLRGKFALAFGEAIDQLRYKAESLQKTKDAQMLPFCMQEDGKIKREPAPRPGAIGAPVFKDRDGWDKKWDEMKEETVTLTIDKIRMTPEDISALPDFSMHTGGFLYKLIERIPSPKKETPKKDSKK